MYLGQNMSLPTGQVADKIYLPAWTFNLPQATGQPLMSHPDPCTTVRNTTWVSTLAMWHYQWYKERLHDYGVQLTISHLVEQPWTFTQPRQSHFVLYWYLDPISWYLTIGSLVVVWFCYDKRSLITHC